MKTRVWSMLLVAAMVLMAATLGCKKGTKPAAPDTKTPPAQGVGEMIDKTKEGVQEAAEDVKAKAEEVKEAAAAQVEELKKKAMEQKEKFLALGDQIKKTNEEIKALKPTEMVGAKATEYKDKLSKLMTEQSTIKDAFDAIVKQIKEVGGDVSDLKLQ